MGNSQERKEVLLSSYRMFGLHDDEGGVNRTHGLLYVVNDFFGKTHSITRYPDSTWVIKK